MECIVCGVSNERAVLFSAVGRDGIIRICKNCAAKESIPIIKRAEDLDGKGIEKTMTVYERLAKMANLDPQRHKLRVKEAENSERIRKQNQELKRIAERKDLTFFSAKQSKPETKENLIRNYHWAIFNARRAKKITQAQLAEAISESESSIKFIEKGILPNNYLPILRKIQVHLNVQLFNKPIEESEKQLGFDAASAKQMTLSDLKKDSSNSFFPYWRKKLGIFQKKGESKETEEELSKESEKEED